MIRAELHCHTNYSMDGMMSLDQVFNTARKVKLDVLAITDHDEIEGAIELQRLVNSRRSGPEIIVGEERTLGDGSHLIGLFLKRKIESTNFEEAVDEIYDQGGLCVVPHPFRKKDGLCRDSTACLDYFGSRPAGFEIYNAKCSHETNQLAQLEEHGLCPCGGSDAHYASDLGESISLIERSAGTSLRSLIEAMFVSGRGFQLMGKAQRASSGERRYAPAYYKVKPFLRLPKAALPLAKSVYRTYRDLRYGIGDKTSVTVYDSH